MSAFLRMNADIENGDEFSERNSPVFLLWLKRMMFVQTTATFIKAKNAVVKSYRKI